jgi:hypothetical protein
LIGKDAALCFAPSFPELVSFPVDILLNQGQLHITTAGSNALWTFDLSSKNLSFIQIPMKAPSFPGPLIYSDGNDLLVGDPAKGVIWSTSGENPQALCGGESPGFQDGKKAEIKIASIGSFIFYEGDLWFTDTWNQAIREINPGKPKVNTIFSRKALPEGPPFFPLDLVRVRESQYFTSAGSGKIYKNTEDKPEPLSLLYYDCLKLEEGEIMDIRDGDSLYAANGVNQIIIEIEPSDNYMLDESGLSSVRLNSRDPNFLITEDDLNDGRLTLTFLGGQGPPATDFTLELDLFLVKEGSPSEQYRKSLGIYFPVVLEENRPLHQEIKTTINLNRQR